LIKKKKKNKNKKKIENPLILSEKPYRDLFPLQKFVQIKDVGSYLRTGNSSPLPRRNRTPGPYSHSYNSLKLESYRIMSVLCQGLVDVFFKFLRK